MFITRHFWRIFSVRHIKRTKTPRWSRIRVFPLWKRTPLNIAVRSQSFELRSCSTHLPVPSNTSQHNVDSNSNQFVFGNQKHSVGFVIDENLSSETAKEKDESSESFSWWTGASGKGRKTLWTTTSHSSTTLQYYSSSVLTYNQNTIMAQQKS